MKPQIGQVAVRLDGSGSRKLGQPLVEQKIRPLAAEVVADVRRRIRRIAPARAEVDWVMDRESMVPVCFSGVARIRWIRRRPGGSLGAHMRRTEAGLVDGRLARRGSGG